MSCSGSPIPESCRICGDPIVPAQKDHLPGRAHRDGLPAALIPEADAAAPFKIQPQHQRPGTQFKIVPAQGRGRDSHRRRMRACPHAACTDNRTNPSRSPQIVIGVSAIAEAGGRLEKRITQFLALARMLDPDRPAGTTRIVASPPANPPAFGNTAGCPPSPSPSHQPRPSRRNPPAGRARRSSR